jgi:phosphatidylglycerophosphate synthase
MADHPATTPALETGRRPAVLRAWAPVRAVAGALARRGASPNAISLAGLGAAAGGAAALVAAAGAPPGRRAALLGLAALLVVLRGLCNLCDGLVAVEGGRRTRAGEVFNDLPDRPADALLLAAAGWSVPGAGWERDLGWLAAVLAVMTAHVRALGVACGAAAQYGGPMAKPARMALLAAACVAGAAEALAGLAPRAMTAALGVIVAGAALTVLRRARRIVGELEAR